MAYYIVAVAQGILTFISPCILPLLPVYIVYLAGNHKESNKKGLFFHALAFVLGFTLVFTLLGASATFIGSFLKNNEILFRRISGILMMIIGFHFLGIINIKFLNHEKGIEAKEANMNIKTAFIFGILFSFAWSPCLTAFLGQILILASTQETMLQGISLLFVYSLGLGIPFIITAILYDKLASTLTWIKTHFRIIRLISGGLLIITGLLVLLDLFKYLSF